MYTLALDNDMIPVLAIVGSMSIAVIAIAFGTVKSILETRARESTKREIAAYVAEGSISPDDAEKILKADLPHWQRGRNA